MSDTQIRKNISENLKYYMKQNNLNNRELADILNVSESTVGKWLLEKTVPRMGVIEQLARYFNIDKSDLIEKKIINLEDFEDIKIIKKFKDVPILGEIACGEAIFCNANYEDMFRMDVDLDDPDFCLKARGDSMIDVGINDGDLVFFKSTPVVENGKIAAVILDDTITLKRFFKNNNEIILRPENKFFSPIIIREEDCIRIEVIGEMIGLYSKASR